MPRDELLRLNNHFWATERRQSWSCCQPQDSTRYVARETRRALVGVAGKCRILPGIDVGIPTGRSSRKASPEDTYVAAAAALKAGSDGVIISRIFSEMRLENLAAAGHRGP